MASYLKVILRLAAKAGPIALIAARELAPQIQRILKDNPDAFSSLTGRFQKVLGSKEKGSSPKGLEARSVVLREQVTYLYASANTADVAQQAISWRNELDAIERSVPVIKVMKRSQQISERRKLSKRLDELSAQIFAASLIDDVEDAVVIHDGTSEEHDGPNKEAPLGGGGQPEATSPENVNSETDKEL